MAATVEIMRWLSSMRQGGFLRQVFLGYARNFYERKKGNVWKVVLKRKSCTSLNFHVYTRNFIH